MARRTFESMAERVKKVGWGFAFQRTNLTYRNAEKYELFSNHGDNLGTTIGYHTLAEAEYDVAQLEKGNSPITGRRLDWVSPQTSRNTFMEILSSVPR